jgi:hypothetical protein
MVARVTDLDGRITGAHRTWLDPDGFDLVCRSSISELMMNSRGTPTGTVTRAV